MSLEDGLSWPLTFFIAGSLLIYSADTHRCFLYSSTLLGGRRRFGEEHGRVPALLGPVAGWEGMAASLREHRREAVTNLWGFQGGGIISS